MNCCFMCSSFKPLSSARSEVSSSMAEYLEKEKICQEICKTITASVESTDNAITSLNVPNLALLPELNTDDIEGILHQISAILTPRNDENSQGSDLEGLSDSRSVEEILREAENLVRASTPYFERRSSGSVSSWSPIPKLSVTKKLKKHEKNDKQTVNITEPVVEILGNKNTQNSTSPLPLETNSPEACGSNITEIAEINLPNENQESSVPNVPENCIAQCDLIHGQTPPVKSVSYEESLLSDCTDEMALNVGDKTKKLSISDLATPEQNCTFTLKKLPTSEMMRKGKITNVNSGGVQISHSDMQKLQTGYEEKLFHLQKQIEILQGKLMEAEKSAASGNNNLPNDTAYNVDKQRLGLLEEELRSKEQLIRDYQRENQRLCNELSSSKVRVCEII